MFSRNHLCRARQFALLWLLGVTVAVRAQMMGGTVAGEKTAAATPSLLEVPVAATWEVTGNLRVAAGYKDNLLLGSIRPQQSALARAEAEVFWWRFPTERFEALAFVNATLTRFFDSVEDPSEGLALAYAEARWFIKPTVRAVFTGEGYYMDQVFDLSETDVERVTAKLQLTGGTASAMVHWEFLPATWVELKPVVQRDRYRDGSNDNHQMAGRAALAHKFGERVELSVAAQVLRRDYDNRRQYTDSGRPMNGTSLSFGQREAELGLSLTWDRAERWQTVTTVKTERNDDNGSGYFDYRARAVKQALTWARAPWNVRLTSGAARYDYDVQIVGIGIDPPKRVREEFSAKARVKRQLGRKLTVFAEYEWERLRSNDPLVAYRVNTALAGLDWSF
jgi:hypothetical protein